MPNTRQSSLFSSHDPLFLLEIYAYRTTIMRYLAQVRKRRVDGEHVFLPLHGVEYNVQLAQFELLHECALFELSESLMDDDEALLAFIEWISGKQFPLTDEALEIFRNFLVTYYPTDDVLTSNLGSRIAMANELKRLALLYPHEDAQAFLGPIKCWEDKECNQYFEMFPLEEIRLPLVSAARDLRAHAHPEFWTMSEVLVFGPKQRQDEQETNLSIFTGESWEETLPGDDDEPWKT